MGDFCNFVKNDIKSGLLTALLVVVVGVLLGCLIFDGEKKPLVFEHDVYQAIQSQGNDQISPETVNLFKQILSDENNQLLRLSELRKTNSDYVDMIFDKRDNLEKIIANPNIDISQIISVPEWKVFFTWAGIISWLVISLCTVFNLWTSNDTVIACWDWKKIWVYPVLLIMFPFWIVWVVLEIIYLLIKKLCLFFINLNKIPPKNIKTINNSLPSVIRKLKHQLPEARKKYIASRVGLIKNQEAKLKHDTDYWRERLKDLGLQVQSTQEYYSNSRQALSNWLANIEKIKDQTKLAAAESFRTILKIPHVAAVDVKDNSLIIYTDTVIIDYLGRNLKIGVIEVTIDMSASKIIGFKNLCSTHPSKYNHPYAKENSFCWGSLRESIYNALEAMEFASAIHLIITAIYSSEGDHTGVFTGWKEVH